MNLIEIPYPLPTQIRLLAPPYPQEESSDENIRPSEDRVDDLEM
jgi:hypothetical protein